MIFNIRYLLSRFEGAVTKKNLADGWEYAPAYIELLEEHDHYSADRLYFAGGGATIPPHASADAGTTFIFCDNAPQDVPEGCTGITLVLRSPACTTPP